MRQIKPWFYDALSCVVLYCRTHRRACCVAAERLCVCPCVAVCRCTWVGGCGGPWPTPPQLQVSVSQPPLWTDGTLHRRRSILCVCVRDVCVAAPSSRRLIHTKSPVKPQPPPPPSHSCVCSEGISAGCCQVSSYCTDWSNNTHCWTVCVVAPVCATTHTVQPLVLEEVFFSPDVSI